MELIRPVLILILVLGLCYTMIRGAPMGDNDPVIGLPNPQCDLDVDLNTTRCSSPDNVNNIVDEETDSSLPLCDCPEKSECEVVKVGEIYKCESAQEQAAEEEDLKKYSMNMLLDEN